jgi:Flp pilus assembly protein CpaB
MLRRSPRAALLWAGALVVTFATTLVVVDALSSLRHQDATYGRLRPLVVARHDLTLGTTVTGRDVTLREVRGDAPPGLADQQAALGRVVRVPVLAGSPVTARHLVPADRGPMSGVLPAGARGVRVVVEHGPAPTAGDVVDVLATFDPQLLGDADDPTILVAAAVPVLAVERPDGQDAVAITVMVSPDQARRIAFSASAGIVGIALAPPEAATGRG